MIFIKVLLLTFLTYCAGTWAYTFFLIIKDGSVYYNEPVRWIICAEFSTACVITICGLIWIIHSFTKVAK